MWSGPTVLLAPSGTLLNAHAGRPPPSLGMLAGAHVKICHGVSVHDSVALAHMAPSGRCSLERGRDDHFLWRLAGGSRSHCRYDGNIPLVNWLVDLPIGAAVAPPAPRL